MKNIKWIGKINSGDYNDLNKLSKPSSLLTGSIGNAFYLFNYLKNIKGSSEKGSAMNIFSKEKKEKIQKRLVRIFFVVCFLLSPLQTVFSYYLLGFSVWLYTYFLQKSMQKDLSDELDKLDIQDLLSKSSKELNSVVEKNDNFGLSKSDRREVVMSFNNESAYVIQEDVK